MNSDTEQEIRSIRKQMTCSMGQLMTFIEEFMYEVQIGVRETDKKRTVTQVRKSKWSLDLLEHGKRVLPVGEGCFVDYLAQVK